MHAAAHFLLPGQYFAQNSHRFIGSTLMPGLTSYRVSVAILGISLRMTDCLQHFGWLTGGGEMGARMRAMGWSATPPGPLQAWPHGIRTAVSICLNPRFPIVLWPGAELRLIYNDAYIPFLGETKHPAVLDAPGREGWGEIRDTIGAMHAEVAAGRASLVIDRQRGSVAPRPVRMMIW
jgi:hypothetical protein